MFFADGGCDEANGFATTGGIVRGKNLVGEVLAPELSGDDIHLVLYTQEFGFGIGQNFICRDAGIEHESKFFAEQFAAQSPFAVGTQAFAVFEEDLMFLQCGEG